MLEVVYTRIPVGGETVGYRARGVALRRLAGEMLARRFARERGYGDDLEIRREEKGKPYLAGVEGLHFNISHAGDLVVAAFSDRPVGIDIERHGRGRLEIARRFFHAEEVAALLSAGEEEQARLFVDYWAIKESFLKYLGTGLTRPLSTFRVETRETGVRLHDGEALLPLHVRRCPVAAGYSCFTCGETEAFPRVSGVTLPDFCRP
jgi:4'-phosphopantetheinyl transferase